MERRDKKTKKAARKKPPRVPIKTYRWEDVRRARARGGYPWTYLYKGQYLGIADPEEFTMEALRKSRSSSTIGKSDGVEIEEVTNGYEEKTKEKGSPRLSIKDDHSKKRLTPEPVVTQDDSANEEVESEVERDRPEIVALESAESSDNISQYVDKEYKLASNPNLARKNNIPESEKKTQTQKSTPTTSKTDVTQRAKSEEPKRKRKLSIESSYSRISLSKLGVMKKLKEAREKMKIPKLRVSLSASNLKRLRSKKSKSKEKELKNPPQQELKTKKGDLTTMIPKNVPSPVYIHIPLKPPEGQTDEFSYLEFGDKKEVKPAKPKFSFKSLGARVIQESKSSENITGSQQKLDDKSSSENITGSLKKLDEKPTSEYSTGSLQKLDNKPEGVQAFKTPSTVNKKQSQEDISEKCSTEIKLKEEKVIESPKIVAETAKREQVKSTDQEEKTISSTSSDKKDGPKITEVTSRPKSETKSVPKLGTFEVGSSTESDEISTTVYHLPPQGKSRTKIDIDTREVRARSAEPEKKRKRSIDSAYSRISLSKLGFLKRLKDTADKLKIPKLSLSRSNSQKEKQKEAKKIKRETSVVETKPIKSPKNEIPVYIHIPLKPPPGEADEFSYLEFEEKKATTAVSEKQSEESPVTSGSPSNNPIQFIFLTAPSDDEILDDKPDVPDTPSSDDTKTFFDTKVEKTLKQIAAEAVDKVSPGTRRRQLESVTEDSEKGSKNNVTEVGGLDSEVKATEAAQKDDVTKTEKIKEIKDDKEEAIEKADKNESKGKECVVQETVDSEMPEEDKPQPELQTERIVIDEEDGLKSSEIAKPDEVKQKELKSVLKCEGSPVLKKKVSFKRRSKTDTKEGEYEDVKKPDELKEDGKKDKAVATLGTSQSMSVDEEKSYLDQKIIKDTSLEEDYNKWSKISDHEYEPINPPPDDVKPITVDIERKSHSLTRSSFDNRLTGDELSDEETLSAKDMQQQMEDRFFNPTSPKLSEVQKRPASEPPEEHKSRRQSASESAAKIQQAIKAQTDKVKSKFQNMKKPNIKFPTQAKFKKPNMQKFKIERPKINLPKMPAAPKMDFKSFSLPRKSKQSLKQRQFSTESNAGDSKRSIFDFSTYPRIFKKKRDDSFESSSSKNDPDVGAVKKTNRDTKDSRKLKETDRWGGQDIIRIPLHSEDSMDIAENDIDREDSVERRMASHTRYDEDIDDIDDAYQKENQEIHKASPFSNNFNSRWKHGIFHPDPKQEPNDDLKPEDFDNEDFDDHHNNLKNLGTSNRGLRIEDLTENNNNNDEYKVTDLDYPEFNVHAGQQDSFDTNNGRDIESSESSFEPHRRGVLEEINSDEFFLRQKGISQDNIDMGRILSSEIREAFRTDKNALSQMEYSDNMRLSNQSLPEASSKKKSIKKPKRRKTPHASQEQIRYADQESEEDMPTIPPCRPKRRSKRERRAKTKPEVIPYQETINVEIASTREELLPPDISIMSRSDDEHDMHFKAYYENQHMEGKDQPIIQITDPYRNLRYESGRQRMLPEFEPPAAPPRRRSRSLKSLSLSEQDSILGTFEGERHIPLQNVEVYKTEHEYIIPIPHSEGDSIFDGKARDEFMDRISKEPPIRPIRKRSRTRSLSRATSHTEEDRLSHGDESLISENQPPCIEEPCVQTVCDYMGYAIVDKSKCREPPLPPPRTTPRKRKPKRGGKFSTVPRFSSEPPVRPLRNYSTLGPSDREEYDEEKENIDISQYIEIEDEHNRNLQSGDIIQKMRERPLPAPPRPPRKSKPLRDITSEENIVSDSMKDINKETLLEETEVSTQTEPLPDDFVCEEVVQEENDRVLSPTRSEREKKPEEEITVRVERRLITPTHYTHEETVTHGSLLVEPLNGAQILPVEQLTKTERIVPVTVDEEEKSEIPEEFHKLRSRPVTERTDRPPSACSEVEILKTQKLQVSDLDVDRLTVNELLANKIVVSEIDSNNIQVNEIGSKSGALRLGEIELPPGVLQQLFEKLQSVAREQATSQIRGEEAQPTEEASVIPEEELPKSGQKKTSIKQDPNEVNLISPQQTIAETQQSFLRPSPDESFPEHPLSTESLSGDNLILSESSRDDLILSDPLPNEHIIDELIISETLDVSSDIPNRLSRQTNSLKADHEKHEDVTQVSEEAISLNFDLERPPEPPPRTTDSSTKYDAAMSASEAEDPIEPPQRPPRQSNKQKESNLENKEAKRPPEEPDVDDEPPPRPPQPDPGYFPSQPPASFYALKAQKYVDNLDDDIPGVSRMIRHRRSPVSESSSEEGPSTHVRRRYRSPEQSIPQLTGQLLNACGIETNRQLKRLISHITNNVLGNADGKQDLHVLTIILLVLIAGLLLLGNSDEKTIHYHHWEYFNPPRDM